MSKTNILYGAFASLLLIAMFIGCEARSQVAMDKLKDRIDSMLGKLDVQRKKIDNEMNSLSKSLGEIQVKRTNAQVKFEQYEQQANAVEEKIGRIKSSMEAFRPHLGTEEPVTIKGKEYSGEQVSEVLNKLLEQLEANRKIQGNLESSVKAFERARNLLTIQEEQGKKAINQMKQTLKEIDAKKEAALAMKDAGSLAGDESITDRFTALQDEVNDLFIGVETAMRVEEEKISDFVDSQSDAVEDILKELENEDDLAARLDEALGKDDKSSDDDQ